MKFPIPSMFGAIRFPSCINVPTTIGATGRNTYPNIQGNRDYYNGVARPGYTFPFTYPHPLVLLDGLPIPIHCRVPPRPIRPPPPCLRHNRI